MKMDNHAHAEPRPGASKTPLESCVAWFREQQRVLAAFAELQAAYPEATYWFASTRAHHTYTEVKFGPKDFLVFGKETAGLGPKILEAHADSAIRIPMGKEQRSLNLSNAAAIVLYEALRQNSFFDLS